MSTWNGSPVDSLKSYILEDGEIELNAGRRKLDIEVANTGDRPIQVGSHAHFFEVNRALHFDRAAAFGMTVVIWSRRFDGQSGPISEAQARDAGLEHAMRATAITLAPTAGDVAAACDVLSIHLALSKETRGLVDESVLSRLKKGAVVINTARGEVRHRDRPGVLAHVFDHLREGNINVQETENIVFEGAEAAVASINLDGEPDTALLDRIRAGNADVLDLQLVTV